MKKIYSLLLAFFATIAISAQLAVTESGGILTFSYNGFNESPQWSTFNPNGASTIYVYTWINAADNSAGVDYNDNWSNVTITLTYNSSSYAYEGTVDLNAYNFTNTNNTLAPGTEVSVYNYILRSQDGNSQSANLSLTTPFTIPPTAAVTDMNGVKKHTLVANGKLYTSQKGNLKLEVYDFTGKIVKTLSAKADGNPIDLQIPQGGKYLVKISGDGVNEVVKFVK